MFIRVVAPVGSRPEPRSHGAPAPFMVHGHDHKHFDTYAAVAGNCPANLLVSEPSAV